MVFAPPERADPFYLTGGCWFSHHCQWPNIFVKLKVQVILSIGQKIPMSLLLVIEGCIMIYLLVYSFCHKNIHIHIYRYDSCPSFRKIIVRCLEYVFLPQAIDLTAVQEDPGKKLKYVQTTQLTRYMCVWPVSVLGWKHEGKDVTLGLVKGYSGKENCWNEVGTICKYCVLQVNIFFQKSTNMENSILRKYIMDEKPYKCKYCNKWVKIVISHVCLICIINIIFFSGPLSHVTIWRNTDGKWQT